MKITQHLRPGTPWLAVLVATPSDVFDAASALEHDRHGRIASRLLRGQKMQTTASLFDEMAAALQFPPYFGENWDALDECLADLEWLSADTYVLTILDAIHLLEKERPEVRKDFWNMLERIAGEWAQPVTGAMPRPARVFRVLVQCSAEEEAVLRGRLPLGGKPGHG